MRYILKTGTGTFHLATAHASPPTTHAQATSRWSRFGHKAPVQQLLLDEQYGLCCYSEFRCDEEGLGFHIEHVEPKSSNPGRTFDYSNLAASGLHSDDLHTFKLAAQQTFGGHARRTPYQAALFVHCHINHCASYFAYLSDGRVVTTAGLSPADVAKAQHTIDDLNLNSPFLVTRRQQWWDELDRLLQEHQQKGWSIPHLAACDLVPSSGKLSRFFSLTRQFYGAVAQQVLLAQAPQLA